MATPDIAIDMTRLGDYTTLVTTITNDIISRLQTSGAQLTLAQTDIVDNLDSSDSHKALSAHMGKVIKHDMQEVVNTIYSNIVDNVTSNSNKHFLSARMGNVLSERIKRLELSFVGSGSGTQNLPSGVILMWSGTLDTIPTGWVFCDGTNGTPDLRDKFIKGVPDNKTNPGGKGGNHLLALETDNLPSHSHNMRHTHTTVPHGHGNHHTHAINIETTSNGAHNHGFVNDNRDWYCSLQKTRDIIRVNHNSTGDKVIAAAQYVATGTQSNQVFSITTKNCLAHVHKITGNTYESTQDTDLFETIVNINNDETQKTGLGKEFDNRPAYYELAYIMKL